MTLGTHVAFASVLYLGGATLFGYRPDWIGWLLAAVASLLPDIDLPTSKIGRLLFWLSVPLERRFGHRTITHSTVGLLAVALYPLSWMGFRDALQAVIKSFDIAHEQYQRQIGTHWYDLELVASDNLTLARVEGRYPIIGTWKGGFIVLHEGQPRAVGKSEAHHNLLPITARLIEGEPLRVQSVKVEMKGRTLRWLLGKIDQRRVYYLSGEIQTARVEPVANIEIYKPVVYSGQTMILRYARAQELGRGSIWWRRRAKSSCSFG